MSVLCTTVLARQHSSDGLWFIASNDPEKFLPPPCSNVIIQLTRNPSSGPSPIWETLAASTANDGSEAVALPIVTSPVQARIRVRALGNIFLDAADANFTLIPPM